MAVSSHGNRVKWEATSSAASSPPTSRCPPRPLPPPRLLRRPWSRPWSSGAPSRGRSWRTPSSSRPPGGPSSGDASRPAPTSESPHLTSPSIDLFLHPHPLPRRSSSSLTSSSSPPSTTGATATASPVLSPSLPTPPAPVSVASCPPVPLPPLPLLLLRPLLEQMDKTKPWKRRNVKMKPCERRRSPAVETMEKVGSCRLRRCLMEQTKTKMT